MKLFHLTCDTIRKLMSQIEELKRSPDKNRSRIAELRALAGLHVLALKKINRLEKARLKAARENTHAAKQRVDTFHLTLQNLLYEIVHVRREINRCLEFRSQDEDISLVSEEEFYRDAPEEISQPSSTREDEHRRHLARLDWELEQRRRLAADCRQLDTDKRRISQRIGQQRKRLSDLAPQLAAVLQSTQPLQEELSLPLDQRRQQHRLAALLPRPLYLLYVQTTAYAEACDSSISATICGSEEEAVTLKMADQRESGDESESDQEAEDEARRKKRHRKSARDEEAARLRKLLHKHPLLVVVEIVCKDLGRLVLEFVHLTQLGIVTVSVGIQDCAVTGALLSAESLLDYLEPGDAGSDSPSAATAHQLRRAGLSPLGQYITAGQLGKPYLWAQRLAGLEFIAGTQDPPAPAAESVAALHVEATMKQIRARLEARVALQGQLDAIGAGKLPLPDPVSAQLPAARESRLVSWLSISPETYRASGVLCAAELDDCCACFLAKLEHPAGLQLSCYVALSPQHPRVPPLVGLKLATKRGASSPRAASSSALRALECELNVSVPSRLVGGSRAAVLPAVLATAATALDVLQRTADGGGEPTHHRLTLRPHRGRDRVPPLRYDPALHMFTHGTG
ncbi:THO complex subunit 5 homolog [Amphibalanus amphitrite]|uniref:THO complex subunit 5 homolog n=1 Tax=Amphibalanus amphitrite TaxID=1232801 RepID=UPI001C903844|nr:THO complex subunit 5 homolog [Amphibalanus amphitrite]